MSQVTWTSPGVDQSTSTILRDALSAGKRSLNAPT